MRHGNYNQKRYAYTIIILIVIAARVRKWEHNGMSKTTLFPGAPTECNDSSSDVVHATIAPTLCSAAAPHMRDLVESF
jgi:hypothetical protein